MATPKLRYPICITIQVMYIPPPVGTNVNPLKRKYEDAEELANFVIWGGMQEDMGKIWSRAEQEFVKAYGTDKLDFKYFTRMKIGVSDVFNYHKVSWFFKANAGPGENVLSFYQDDTDRESSIPANSALRPKGFTLPKPGENPLKRRKIQGAGHGVTVDQFDSDTPVESNEHPHDVTGAGDEHHVGEPEVDKDGFKKPLLPPANRKILQAKSRRPAQSLGPTQNAVLVPDSQPHNVPAGPQSAPAAGWLQSRGDARQHSAPLNHSSPTESAAARAKTAAPEPSKSNGRQTPSAVAGQRKPGSNAGNASKSMLTPPSAENGLADSQEAPTSAQPHSSARTPRLENAANYFRKSSHSNPYVEDPEDEIVDEEAPVDEENLIDEDIDDEMLNEAYDTIAEQDDADYVPPGGNGRGRTRSRSLESIPPQLNTTDQAEAPTSQPTKNASLPVAPAQNSGEPSSSNAFESMRSSQNARSSSRSEPWSREERIAVLKGAKKNWAASKIVKDFKLQRTASAVRNCKAGLSKEFPGLKVPVGHDYYAEVEGGSAPVLEVVTGANVTPAQDGHVDSAVEIPDKDLEIPNKDEWSHEQVQVLSKEVAAGLEAKEIRAAHFVTRTEEAVAQKIKEIWDNVVATERKTFDWPRDGVQLHGWKDLHNLKMRRFVRERLSFTDAYNRLLVGFPVSTVKRKYELYASQYQKLTSRASLRAESPQVVIITERAGTAPPAASNPNQLTGNGGQTRISFPRDKRKKAVGPAGAALRARINQEYGPQARASGSGSATASGSGSGPAQRPRRQPRASAAASASAREILQEISGSTNADQVVESAFEEPEAMAVDTNLAGQDDEVEQEAEPELRNEENLDDPINNIVSQSQITHDLEDVMAEDDLTMMRQLDHAEGTEYGTDPVTGAEHAAEDVDIVHEPDQAEAAELHTDSANEEQDEVMPTADAEVIDDEVNDTTPEANHSEKAEQDLEAASGAESADEDVAQEDEHNDEAEDEIVSGGGGGGAAAAAEDASDDFMTADAPNSRPSTARSEPSKQLSQELQQSADTTPVPEVTSTPTQVVTAPHDLRTIISGPDAHGIVQVGRPGYTATYHKDNIETDDEILARCKRYYPNRSNLARLKYKIERLIVQYQIAEDAKDRDEMDRFNRKLWPLKIFLLLKEQDDSSVEGVGFNKWFERFNEATDWEAACAEAEEADEERGLQKLAMEEYGLDNGFGDEDGEEDYPDGVEHRGEVEEVEEDEQVDEVEEVEKVVKVEKREETKAERKERRRLKRLAKAERRARRAEQGKQKRKHRKSSKGESSRAGESVEG